MRPPQNGRQRRGVVLLAGVLAGEIAQQIGRQHRQAEDEQFGREQGQKSDGRRIILPRNASGLGL